MEEKQKNENKTIRKEIIIPACIGLIVGIALTCLVGFFMDYFAKSAGMAKLKYGDETLATVNGKSISVETIYRRTKLKDGLSFAISEVDKAILDDMYQLTEKEEETAKEEAKYWMDYYVAQGYTEQEFLEGNGFANYDEFLEDVKMNKKSNKYLYDYLEKKLEPGAVQKYYDENKESIETYDSEHILVRISDTVTDEEALALANEIIVKLDEGKSFSEVVEEYGDRIVHEELGYQGKASNLEQTYIDEIVALEDGAYSKTPVKTSYGYHIVHKLATATVEDLRESIIETLSEELLTADRNLAPKAFVELRKEKNLAIYDEVLNKQYEEYCNSLYNTETNS